MALSDTKLKKLAEEHQQLKAKIKELQKQADKRQDAVIAELKRRKMTSYETESGDVRITVTQGSRVDYDESQLKGELSPQAFRAITTRIVDKDRLSQAVQEGKIPAALVDRCSTLVKFNPYIKVTLRDKE